MNTNRDLNASRENKLIQLLANDDADAFEIFYYRYKSKVYHLAMRYLECSESAQDVVQETFLKLWIHRKQIQENVPIEAWLCTVSKNDVLNRCKRKAIEVKAINQNHYLIDSPDNSTMRETEIAELMKWHDAGVKSLSKNQATAYKLAKSHSLSYNQISVRMNISPLTVKTHMSRALNNLRCFLEMRNTAKQGEKYTFNNLNF